MFKIITKAPLEEEAVGPSMGINVQMHPRWVESVKTVWDCTIPNCVRSLPPPEFVQVIGVAREAYAEGADNMFDYIQKTALDLGYSNASQGLLTAVRNRLKSSGLLKQTD